MSKEDLKVIVVPVTPVSKPFDRNRGVRLPDGTQVSVGVLTPERQLVLAKDGLRHIWHRWRKEPDKLRREQIWPLIVEAEKRLEQAKVALGILEEGVCPECEDKELFKFTDEDGLKIIICKKCGWGNRDELLGIVRDTARRIKRG